MYQMLLSSKICKTKPEETERKSEQIHNYNWRPQHSFSTTKKKVSNYLEELNNTISQQDLIDIYRT